MFQSIYCLKLGECHAGRKQSHGFQTPVNCKVGWPGQGQMLLRQLKLPSKEKVWHVREMLHTQSPASLRGHPPANSRVGAFEGLLLPGCQQCPKSQINPFPEAKPILGEQTQLLRFHVSFSCQVRAGKFYTCHYNRIVYFIYFTTQQIRQCSTVSVLLAHHFQLWLIDSNVGLVLATRRRPDCSHRLLFPLFPVTACPNGRETQCPQEGE